MSRSAVSSLLVLCLAGLLLARESRQPDGALAGVDRAFFDWLTANVKPSRAALGGNVTLVEIDDSVAETPARLPLSPLECAAFLQAVGRYEPEVVAIEPILDWPGGLPPGTEQILQEQALRVPRLLLTARLGSNAGQTVDPVALPTVNAVSGKPTRLPDYPEIIAAPDARLLPLAAGVGADNLPGSDLGPLRDLPLLLRCRGRVVPALAMQMLTLGLRLAPSEVSVVLGSHVQFGDRLRLPIDRAGRALLDAGVLPRINRVELDDLALVVSGQGAPKDRVAAELMRHGTVILGRTDRAVRTIHLPGGRMVSPAEVFALAAASLPRTPPIRRASGWGDALVVAAFAGVASQMRRRRWEAVVVLSAVSLFAYALTALSLYEAAGLWLPLALPLGLALATCLLTVLLPDSPPGGAEKP